MTTAGNWSLFIPAAGKGTRTAFLGRPKALATTGMRPVIIEIIGLVHPDVQVVVAVHESTGGGLIREVLQSGLARRKIIFVEAEPTGIGTALMAAKPHLPGPFVFCAADSFIDRIPDPSTSWIGVSDTPAGTEYRAVIPNPWKAPPIVLAEKGEYPGAPSYVGACGVASSDLEAFWAAVEAPEGLVLGDTAGLRAILGQLRIENLHWNDVAVPAYLPKGETSAIWFVDDLAIKWFADPVAAKSFAVRAEILAPLVPRITYAGQNVVTYEYTDGVTLEQRPEDLGKLLEWCRERLWITADVDIRDAARNHYIKKTEQRCSAFHKRFPRVDCIDLSAFPWDKILDSVRPVRMHGDLHPSNVIVTDDAERPFVLLDWRSDFGGEKNFGDIYYDLAKVLMGAYFSHARTTPVGVEIPAYTTIWSDLIREWVIRNGLSWENLNLVTAVAFLSSATLHQNDEVATFLYGQGNKMLELASGET